MLLGGAVVFAYLPSLHGEFVFDDHFFVEGNVVKSLDAPLAADKLHPNSRPVVYFTLALNYRLSHLDPFGYHATNLAIHLGVAALVFLFTLRTFREAAIENALAPAYLVTAVFALHPLQTQAVSYITQRGESLASLFYLATLLLFLRAADPRGSRAIRAAIYLAALATFGLGLGSKQILFTLPAAYLLHRAVFDPARRSSPGWRWLRGQATFLAPYLLLDGLAMWSTLRHLRDDGTAGFEVAGLTPWTYLLTQGRVVLAYLRLLFVPVGQSGEHDVAISRSLLEPPALVAIVVITALFAGCLYLLMRFRVTAPPDSRWAAPLRLAGFGGVWFFLILAPTSSVIPIGDVMMEHRVYLASWGVISAFVALGWRASAGRRRVFVATAVAAVLSLGAATAGRNRVWRTEEAFWHDVIAKQPERQRGHAALADLLQRQGDLDASLREYETALGLPSVTFDRRVPLLQAIGTTQLRLGRREQARETLHRALALQPADPFSLNSLAILAMEDGDLESAERLVRRALHSTPRHGAALNTLGEILLARGDPAGAFDAFVKALAADPDVPVRLYNAGVAAEAAHQTEAACTYFRRYLQVAPGAPDAHDVRSHLRDELGCR